MYDKVEERCLKALQASYHAYSVSGPRSNAKLKPLHGWVASELKSGLGSTYKVVGIGNEVSRETKIDGWYYPKKVDVSVSMGEKVIGVVSIKFVMSNYRQNVNNYLETQMGETANLRRNNIVFGHLICFPIPMPYFQRDKNIKKYECLRDKDIEKYHKLASDYTHPHAPDVQGFVAAHYCKDEKAITRICTRNDLYFLSDQSYEIIERKLNVRRFFEIMVGKIQGKYQELK